jgi:hypothetical protein
MKEFKYFQSIVNYRVPVGNNLEEIFYKYNVEMGVSFNSFKKMVEEIMKIGTPEIEGKWTKVKGAPKFKKPKPKPQPKKENSSASIQKVEF